MRFRLVMLIVLAFALAAPVARAAADAGPATLRDAADAYKERVREGIEHTRVRRATGSGATEYLAGWPFLQPAGDLDGDGRRDVLAFSFDDATGRVILRGLRGTDGTVLWTRRELAGFFAFPMPARLGPDGRDGVLYFTLREIDTPVAFVFRMRLLALAGDGATVWDRTLEGTLVLAPGLAIGRDLPHFRGVLDAVPGAAQEVLVGREDTTYPFLVPIDRSEVMRAHVLDGADGSVASESSMTTTGAYPVPFAGPDLSGDGLDDYLFLAESYAYGDDGRRLPNALSAHRGTDGTELWRTVAPVTTGSRLVVLGDATGDGVPDWALQPGERFDGVGALALLDGSSGALRWSVPEGWPRRLGDADGDGLADVGVQYRTYCCPGGRLDVTYAALDGTGAAVYTAAYGVPWPEQAIVTATWTYPDLGDLDGDGVTDAGHDLQLVDLDAERFYTERGAVSGRTGAKLWSGRVRAPLYTSVDGAGDDLASLIQLQDNTTRIIAQDGATGETLWDVVLPRRASAEELRAADLDGDGRAELVVQLTAGEAGDPRPSGAVLRAADGSILWSFTP